VENNYPEHDVKRLKQSPFEKKGLNNRLLEKKAQINQIE
jgi:hypothetical protein